MRQVPRFAVIGNGRMAKHMAYYFDALHVSYQSWARRTHTPSQLADILEQSTHVLLLISDNAIDSFIQECELSSPQYSSLIKIHFSGSLVSPFAYSAHPLQSFADELYSLSEYEAIPFVLDENSPDFKALLPGLKNPHYRIISSDRAYYHAMCVMANNFSTILWQKFFLEMTGRFNINQKDLLPFLNQSFRNLAKDPAAALTGPIPRNDTLTLQRNLAALKRDDFYPIYKAFFEKYFPEASDEIHS
jgi:predicted short-subunit dehydrogenase-like oxidoreductase (DUF2520 family)